MGIESPIHLIFIAVIALIVLGPKRLPELARSLGHGMREFRGAMSGAMDGEEHAHAPAAPVPGQAQLTVSSESTQAPPSSPLATAAVATPEPVHAEPAAPAPPGSVHAEPVATEPILPEPAPAADSQ
jgi:sec-independent protein translocase protein TatA